MIWSWTAEATTKPMRYLTVAEYAADRAKLRTLAIENLRRALPKI